MQTEARPFKSFPLWRAGLGPAALAGALAAALAAILAAQGGALAGALLALFAAVGVFAAFARAAGLPLRARAATPETFAALACELNPQAMVLSGPDGEVLYANRAYRALCGGEDLRAPERLFGEGEDAAAVYRLAEAARGGAARVEDLSHWRRALGHAGGHAPDRLRVETRGVVLADGRRATLWLVGDVAREAGDAARLRQAAEMLDALPAGVFSFDESGAILAANPAFDDFAGQGVRALAAAFGEKGAAALLASGEAAGERVDLDLSGADGRGLPARILRRRVLGAGGSAMSVRVGLVLAREAAQERAGDQRSIALRIARMFEATPIAIASVDASGAILRSNGAFARVAPEALKPGVEGAPGSILRAAAERDRPTLQAALAAAADGAQEIAPLDVALAGEGDRSARFFISAAAGEVPGATVFALDTTEQRALQNNFAQSQKMQAIGQLAGGVAHDFNNVLTAIIGFSDLLLASHRATDPSFRDIMQIKQNALRAAGLVRQLLAFSRRQTMRPQVLQLGDVLSDLQLMMRRLVGEKIHLELRHGRDLWPVKADHNQFQQVIVNLIVNARDAMPDGGAILLKTRNVAAAEVAGFGEQSIAEGDYVAIEVEDEGCGVPPEVRDKIFEPFFTTKEVGKGTGLGLAMVYGVVKQSGGYVFCQSPPGGGATFTVLLPRHLAEAEAEAAPAAPEAAKPAADLTGRGVILLVEDEEAVRAFGARALASRGYSVLQAASGIEALEAADENPGRIDLIVSDVVMPEMDGPTMLGELRKRGVSAKVIFVSGYAEEAFARNLPEGEAFGFLPKPFTLKQLIEAVKAAA
ncbi:response regulator [Methylocella sp.]|uniref:response regulator n=1 Tax=Methylocella sp. TaxID=1978226 RepID=UPI00387ED300